MKSYVPICFCHFAIQTFAKTINTNTYKLFSIVACGACNDVIATFCRWILSEQSKTQTLNGSNGLISWSYNHSRLIKFI